MSKLNPDRYRKGQKQRSTFCLFKSVLKVRYKVQIMLKPESRCNKPSFVPIYYTIYSTDTNSATTKRCKPFIILAFRNGIMSIAHSPNILFKC